MSGTKSSKFAFGISCERYLSNKRSERNGRAIRRGNTSKKSENTIDGNIKNRKVDGMAQAESID